MLDGHIIANYRLSAELTAIDTTTDGRCVVIGTLDGCLSVLAIADPSTSDSVQFLASLPSRTRQARPQSAIAEDHDVSFDENGSVEAIPDRDNVPRAHVTFKTTAMVAAAWVKTSQEGIQKVTSKTCVIS